MTEVVSGDLADGPVSADPNVPDMRNVLPVDELRKLAGGIEKVLAAARARGGDEVAWVATFVAPEIAARDSMIADLRAEVEGNRLQLAQAGAALAESMAASVKVADQAVRLGELAHARAVVAHRLRTELWSALPDAERHRTLTEQDCPVGLHDGWFAPSGGREHVCPWCLIAERTAEVDRLREHIAECHRLQSNVAAVVGVETDWDAAGRKAVLDAVCRMSGNLADARMAAEPEGLADDSPAGRPEDASTDDDAPTNVLCDLLALAGVTVPWQQIMDWTLTQRREAQHWAIATHLSASDNPVDVPARPAFLDGCCVHGPHPHAGLSCPDCETCQGGASS